MRTNPRVVKPVQVKVCGIREPSESAALDALGVDWIGYNFHPGSARRIAPETAAPLARALRRAKPVGVFVDADIQFVIDVIAETGIRFVQLHGNEDWDYVSRMPVPVIKAIPHTRLADCGGLRAGLEAALRKGERTPLAYFLVDTQASAPGVAGAAETVAPGPGSGGSGGSGGKTGGEAGQGVFGGSGQVFDWELLKRHPLPLPYFLAGGLGPHNLAQALEAISPFAVDLNSKVEIAPGRKDLDKVKACLEIMAAAV
ncbi:MAG: phosphoribosylanthranilate isomerase [Fibrobacteria bacterium]